MSTGSYWVIFMFKNLLDEILGIKDPLPNKFTIRMGELVRKARIDSGLKQNDLAKNLYISQAAISEIENGKREISSRELLSLSHFLEKPLYYFFHENFTKYIYDDPPLIQELIIQANRLSKNDLNKAIAIIKALSTDK